MITWTTTFDDGSHESGLVDDQSWIRLKGNITKKIVRLDITNGSDGGGLSDPARSFYLINKSIATFPFGDTIDMVGIGFIPKNEDIVKVMWFDKSNMNLIKTEAKPIDKCEYSLIHNEKS